MRAIPPLHGLDRAMTPVAGDAPSAWSPLRHRAFRLLWLSWLTANICLWTYELASAWLMTTLTTDPVLIGLVRTASTLPAFLLALPCGALADLVDRRRWYLGTQLWAATTSGAMALAIWLGTVTPALLLVMGSVYAVAFAMRWPTYAAIVPHTVPADDLPQAIALNSVSANASRIIGPIMAGAVLSWLGSGWVFAFNAALSLGAALLVLPWRPPQQARLLPRERLLGAMRAGLRYAAQSPPLKAVLLHAFLYFVQNAALLALLPLVVLRVGGGESSYTLAMCAMSVGAITTAATMPKWRRRVSATRVVQAGSLVYALAAVAAALAPNTMLLYLVLLPAGGAWIVVANVLNTSGQQVLPDGVRARGMSMILMAVMGGYAFGAALWGAVARYGGVTTSLMAASGLAVLGLWLTRRVIVPDAIATDSRPSPLAGVRGPGISPIRSARHPQHSKHER